jgi:hypothetical protein
MNKMPPHKNHTFSIQARVLLFAIGKYKKNKKRRLIERTILMDYKQMIETIELQRHQLVQCLQEQEEKQVEEQAKINCEKAEN